MASHALLLANRRLCMELNLPANPFQPAGTSRHEHSHGETATGSRRAGRYVHLPASSQRAPVPLFSLAEVAEALLMPLPESGASAEVVHVELSTLCVTKTGPAWSMWQSRG